MIWLKNYTTNPSTGVQELISPTHCIIPRGSATYYDGREVGEYEHPHYRTIPYLVLRTRCEAITASVFRFLKKGDMLREKNIDLDALTAEYMNDVTVGVDAYINTEDLYCANMKLLPGYASRSNTNYVNKYFIGTDDIHFTSTHMIPPPKVSANEFKHFVHSIYQCYRNIVERMFSDANQAVPLWYRRFTIDELNRMNPGCPFCVVNINVISLANRNLIEKNRLFGYKYSPNAANIDEVLMKERPIAVVRHLPAFKKYPPNVTKILIIPFTHILPTIRRHGASMYRNVYQNDPLRSKVLNMFLGAAYTLGMEYARRFLGAEYKHYMSSVPGSEDNYDVNATDKYRIYQWLHGPSNSIEHLHIHTLYVVDGMLDKHYAKDIFDSQNYNIFQYCKLCLNKPLNCNFSMTIVDGSVPMIQSKTDRYKQELLAMMSEVRTQHSNFPPDVSRCKSINRIMVEFKEPFCETFRKSDILQRYTTCERTNIPECCRIKNGVIDGLVDIGGSSIVLLMANTTKWCRVNYKPTVELVKRYITFILSRQKPHSPFEAASGCASGCSSGYIGGCASDNTNGTDNYDNCIADEEQQLEECINAVRIECNDSSGDNLDDSSDDNIDDNIDEYS